jgi:hypothetical protein
MILESDSGESKLCVLFNVTFTTGKMHSEVITLSAGILGAQQDYLNLYLEIWSSTQLTQLRREMGFKPAAYDVYVKEYYMSEPTFHEVLRAWKKKTDQC